MFLSIQREIILFWSCRAGFIFTRGIDGLQTSGKERQMEKDASILNPAMCFSASFEMDCDMVISCVLMLMEQG